MSFYYKHVIILYQGHHTQSFSTINPNFDVSLSLVSPSGGSDKVLPLTDVTLSDVSVLTRAMQKDETMTVAGTGLCNVTAITLTAI